MNFFIWLITIHIRFLLRHLNHKRRVKTIRQAKLPFLFFEEAERVRWEIERGLK